MNRKDIVKLLWPNKTIVSYDSTTDTIVWNALDPTPNPTNAELDAAIAAYTASNTFVPTVLVGVANGAASLDPGGKIPLSQLPQSLSSAVSTDTNGCLTLLNSTLPVTPDSDRCTLYAMNMAGRNTPAFLNANGAAMGLQSHLASCNAGSWTPNGNNTTISSFGLAAPALFGNVTARSVTTTNLFTSTRRIGLVSSNGAGSSCGARLPSLQFWRGNSAGLGGFLFSSRFGISDPAPTPTARMFVGLYGVSSAIGSIQPSSLLNLIGVGCDAGESVLKLIWNDATATASTLSLGSAFPANTSNSDLYEFNLYAPSNVNFVNYQIINLRTGTAVAGNLTSNLPASTQLLAPQFWRNNGSAGGGSVGLDLVSLYMETDY